MTPQEIVGRRIWALRLEKGMTQEQLGVALGEYLGNPWPKQSVSAAEKGLREFNAPELFAFAAVFGQTIASIVTPQDPAATVSFPSGKEIEAAALVNIPEGIPAEAAQDLLRWAYEHQALSVRAISYLQTLLKFPEDVGGSALPNRESED